MELIINFVINKETMMSRVEGMVTDPSAAVFKKLKAMVTYNMLIRRKDMNSGHLLFSNFSCTDSLDSKKYPKINSKKICAMLFSGKMFKKKLAIVKGMINDINLGMVIFSVGIFQSAFLYFIIIGSATSDTINKYNKNHKGPIRMPCWK